MRRMTVLEACVRALEKAGEPMSAERIHELVVSDGLYSFQTKDPLGVVRSALRRHLRGPGPHQVAQAAPGVFKRS